MHALAGILQARVAATRLPGKMLLPLGGTTVLEFLLQRLSRSKRVKKWVVATTEHSDDDPLAAAAMRAGYDVFRGSSSDVLDRTYQCALAHGMEHIVRAGGDNPLLDPRLIDDTVDAYLQQPSGWDYFSNHHPPTFPDGQEVEIIPMRSLETAWHEARRPHEREHGTPFLWDQPHRFRVGNYARHGDALYYEHRWTLDYPEDYDLVKRIVAEFGGASDFSLGQIVALLEAKPEIYALNLSRHGDTWHSRERDKLQTIDQYRQVRDKSFGKALRNERRKVCCVVASRAEYSRFRAVLRALNDDPRVELQIIAAGANILDRYGHAVDDLEADGLKVAARCFTLVEGETPTTMTKSIGLSIMELASAFGNLQPDIVPVMGDRFDAIATALAAVSMNVPIAHIQGGETSGSIDESLRHAITKLAHIHFPATELSRQRIVSMGEDPAAVFNVGCPAVDTLLSTPILPVDEVLRHPLLAPKRPDRPRFEPLDGYVLAMFHPVTTEYDAMAQETTELLLALDELRLNVFWVWPNADAGARKIIKSTDRYTADSRNQRFEFFDHVPMPLFVSLMANARLMVGNSSAGVREACYFGVPVVDVGSRQANRERPSNVTVVRDVQRGPLLEAFRAQIEHGPYASEAVYGNGTAGQQIAKILAESPLPSVQKRFNDQFVPLSITQLA